MAKNGWLSARLLPEALLLPSLAVTSAIAAAPQTLYTYEAKGRLTKAEIDAPGAMISSYAHGAASNRTNVKVLAFPSVLNASFEKPTIASYIYDYGPPT